MSKEHIHVKETQKREKKLVIFLMGLVSWFVWFRQQFLFFLFFLSCFGPTLINSTLILRQGKDATSAHSTSMQK